jgi:hypothetical protein
MSEQASRFVNDNNHISIVRTVEETVFSNANCKFCRRYIHSEKYLNPVEVH